MRISLLAAVLLALACNKSSEPAAAPSAAPAPSPSAAPNAPAKEQPGASSEAAAATDKPAAGDEAPPTAGGLTWRAPSPFVRRAPKSSMRVAEYGIDGETGAELSVFYFGPGQGGSIEDNMTRWVGQFTQPDGSETKAKRDERNVKGIPIALVEAKGIFSGGMAMPGGMPPVSQNDAMLLGAIAKGPNGAVFFKLTGPRAGLEKSRSAFDGLIESIAPAP